MATRTTIKAIQDIMRKDVGVDGDAQRIGQLVWMLFLKIFDDREAEQALIADEFESPIPEPLRWRSWATDEEGITGDALLEFVNGQLFPTLKELPTDGPTRARALLIRAVFADTYNYMKSGTLMRQVINKLNSDIDFNDSKKRHALGDIYEKVLRDLQNAGNAGEYYTPRSVTNFVVRMVNPRLGETVLDPACGTGGFLTCAIDHVRTREVKTPAQEARVHRSIRGVEKKPLPHLLCITNMILHGVDAPSIRRDNALARPLRDYSERDRVDIIVTNPPFGGEEEDRIKHNFPAALRSAETSLLFLQLVVAALRESGRCGIVLPHGFLFSDGPGERVREMLLKKCDLHTVVRLPEGVFAPYTDIPVNLLFFDKRGPTKEVWFYELPPPPNGKKYTKSKPLPDAAFEPVIEWWGGDSRDGRSRSERAWKVAVDAIRADRFNLDQHNPSTKNLQDADPAVLSREIAEHEQELHSLLAEMVTKLELAMQRPPDGSTRGPR